MTAPDPRRRTAGITGRTYLERGRPVTGTRPRRGLAARQTPEPRQQRIASHATGHGPTPQNPSPKGNTQLSNTGQADTTAAAQTGYHCQNSQCAGTATFPGTCHGKPMVTR